MSIAQACDVKYGSHFQGSRTRWDYLTGLMVKDNLMVKSGAHCLHSSHCSAAVKAEDEGPTGQAPRLPFLTSKTGEIIVSTSQLVERIK